MAKRILIVDDEFDDLSTMKTILENEGYAVTAVSCGEDAITNITKGRFDLILIDIIMPNMSGYELLKLIRKKIDWKIPLAFVSIIPEKEVDMRYIDSFIQKPFNSDEFAEKVKKIILEFNPHKKTCKG